MTPALESDLRSLLARWRREAKAVAELLTIDSGPRAAEWWCGQLQAIADVVEAKLWRVRAKNPAGPITHICAVCGDVAIGAYVTDYGHACGPRCDEALRTAAAVEDAA